MALPTLNVTPGSGATINTLPNAPATTANSVSVALATDQTSVPVTVASLPLPTGAMPANGGSVALAAGINVVGGVIVADPVSGHYANVFQFHNADNVALGATAYGINTGGVAQLLNAAANLDRQREAGVDGVPAQGIASGAASFAMQFKTSSANTISTGGQTVTPVAMSGVIGGVGWSIQTGSALVVDSGLNKEVVVVSAVTAGAFTATFAKAHSTTPIQITGFVYNQGRDASGENDGATGSGTSVAAEYEYNAGDPSGGNFDRARCLNGKGLTTQTISAGGGASSSGLTLAASTGLQPGTKVLLYKSATFPAAGSFESVNVDLSFTVGGNTVPLASPIIGSAGYDTIAYDAFSALGPQLNGFLPFGVGIEEEAIFDPVSGKHYVQRAATQDGMAAQNIVVVSAGLWNGAAMDRVTGSASRGMDVNVSPNPTGGIATYAAVGGTGNPLLTNSTVTAVKTSAGSLYKARFFNSSNAGVWVQLFDAAAASITPGTTVPKDAIWVPGGTGGGAWVETFTDAGRVSFATAISAIAASTATGASAPAANIAATFYFK